MTETKIKVRTTLGVTDHNLLDNRFIDNQHTINAISGLEEALESKQNVLTAGENIEISEEGEISAVDTTYTAGENVSISEENVISATDTAYTAGENVSISEENVISATDTTYTAGENVSIDNGVISATDTTYTAGTGIDITNGVISNTQTSAEWGNVTGNLNDQTDLKNALDAKANSSDLATVATSGSYADLSNKPTIADGILTIQKNGTIVDTFTANSSDNKTVNLVIPTTAADVSAMPDSVKYGASITVAIDSSNYRVTTTLKDQDGNTLGTAQVIDLPLESVVVSGSYDDVNKNVVLTLQNGSTITFSVADLVSGLQSEITSQNKLDADLVDDSTSVNKFVTASDKTTWDGKQDAISDLATIRAGANAGATAVQAGDLATVATTGNYADLSGTPTIPTVIPADNSTIVENASHQLQTVGVVNQNTESGAVSPLKIWNGTQQQWEDGVSQTWYNWENPNGGFSSEEYTSLPNTNIWSYIAYGNNRFVAVPGLAFNADVVAISADDGETWSPSSLPTGHSTRWNAIVFGSNNFVTLGYNSNVAAYSSDGSTWTDVTLPSTERWTAMAYGGGRFVAVSSQMVTNTSAVYSTNDGTSWNASVSKFIFDGNIMCSLVYGNNMFLAIGGINNASNQTAYSTDGGETWMEGTISSSQTWMRAAYGNGKFVAVAKGTNTYAYSSDGLTWTESTLPSSANWMSITFGNGYFVAVADNGKYAYSPDGENWEENTFTSSGWFDVAFGNNKYVAITKDTYITAQLINELANCYTSEAEPTTESTVYSAPYTASALTITAVGTGTITLSDTNAYTYNASGNQTTSQNIGAAHPDYLCNINGVGVKIGSNNIANLTAYSDFIGATGLADGATGLVPAPTTSDVDKYLKGDGTWATVSVDAIANKNTASGATNPLSIWQGTQEEWNTAGGVKDTYYGWDRGVSSTSTVNSVNNSRYAQGSLAYGNGVIIAVNQSGNTDSQGAWKSTDNGNTWTKITFIDEYVVPYCVFFVNGEFILHDIRYIIRSTDGINWTHTSKPSDTPYQFRFLAYGNGIYIGTTSYDKNIYRSMDGINYQVVKTTSDYVSVSYGNGLFLYIKSGGNTTEVGYSTDGSVWNTTSIDNGSYCPICYDGSKFLTCNYSGYIATSTDGITWTTVKQESLLANCDQLWYLGSKFVFVKRYNTSIVYSYDGINWKRSNATITNGAYRKTLVYDDVADLYVSLSGQNTTADIFSFDSYYTLDEVPTTSSQVYTAPDVTSALTITSVDTANNTITLSDTYTYNEGGNAYSYYTVAEAHPNYICFINNVGIKMGNVSFTPVVDQTYSASSINAQSGVAVASGIADTLGTIETALQGV